MLDQDIQTVEYRGEFLIGKLGKLYDFRIKGRSVKLVGERLWGRIYGACGRLILDFRPNLISPLFPPVLNLILFHSRDGTLGFCC